MTWDEAIRQVLRESTGSLHYSEIADRILAEELVDTVGATPAMTVSARLSVSIKNDPTSPFVRTGRGIYAYRQNIEASVADNVPSTALESEPEETSGAVKSLGMFWRRDAVIWKHANTQLLGRQSGASIVDFAGQIGVYLLYDRDRVVYVGQSDSSIAERLSSHTRTRLASRWDRFSWFGLKPVGEDGNLIPAPPSWSRSMVIDTIEAVLIEGLEPHLNRQGGQNFSGIEYLQVHDPEIDREARRLLLTEALSKV